MMLHTRSTLLVVAAAALLTACTRPSGDTAGSATPAGSTTAVATVNGKPISSEMFDVFLRAVTGKPSAEVSAEEKEQLLDQLISMTLAAEAAQKDGLDKDADVKARLDLLHTQILAEAATEKYAETHPISEEALKAEYDQQIASMPKEYKARHILVDDKETAESLIRDIKAGGDFAKLAEKESKDSGSAQQGGDLGWFSPQTMVKPFADAVTGMEVGSITEEPVQSEFGWHVIQLEEVRSPQPPAFEDVKQQVEMLARRKGLQTYLDELRASAKIQKNL
jgi:peptidyl-prolyl cis-trans isomerase C